MVKLTPMSLGDYTWWKRTLVKEYAEATIRAGQVAPEDALDVSQFEFDQLFPEGLKTLDARFYTVVDVEREQQVGMLCVKLRNQRQEMFICDIRIYEEFRAKGYGKQTLLTLEALAREMGIAKISLHVFGDNEIALRLYFSLGFISTNLLMSKAISSISSERNQPRS